jgi:hypothetical protein
MYSRARLSTLFSSAIVAAASSSAWRAAALAADARSASTLLLVSARRFATFGIQKSTPWPAATYACCPARRSPSASAASRAC